MEILNQRKSSEVGISARKARQFSPYGVELLESEGVVWDIAGATVQRFPAKVHRGLETQRLISSC